MLKIKEDHPEASAAVQNTIDFMFGQHHTIGFLSHALASIRADMKELLSDLKLDEEAERIIDTMQSGILTILDLLDVGDGVADSAVGAAAASSSSLLLLLPLLLVLLLFLFIFLLCCCGANGT